MPGLPRLPPSEEALTRIEPIARAVAEDGGRALIVGGTVRDRVMGRTPRGDVDVELFGMDEARARRTLERFGEVVAVGRAFGVLRVKGLDVDFSLPRTSSAGPGVRGDLRRADPALDFASAARRRDLTVNAMGLDPLSGEVLDPLNARDDIRARRLRAADPSLFAEDPVRGLRVARFAACLDMQPDDELRTLCAALDLSGVAAERLFGEWRKLLQEPCQPSVAMTLLAQTSLLRFFPPIEALRGVPQDPGRHPEGDVWVHTLMVLDAASALRTGTQDEALMFAALCHDLGKPAATVRTGDHISCQGHEALGEAIAREFLATMRAPGALIDCVAALVRHHRAPACLPAEGARRGAYRRLARRLQAAGADMALLERVARADHLGRTTPEALQGHFPAGDAFLEQAAMARVQEQAVADAVQGRHLIARGHAPGPGFSALLSRCREIQDETGIDDPDRILELLDAGAGEPRE